MMSKVTPTKDIAQIRHLAAVKAAMTRRRMKQHDARSPVHRDEFGEAECDICQKRAKQSAKWEREMGIK